MANLKEIRNRISSETASMNSELCSMMSIALLCFKSFMTPSNLSLYVALTPATGSSSSSKSASFAMEQAKLHASMGMQEDAKAMLDALRMKSYQRQQQMDQATAPPSVVAVDSGTRASAVTGVEGGEETTGGAAAAAPIDEDDGGMPPLPGM